ncbi:extracellular catalytic domain type 2 short-chain-length polyhydroxyalkanoate depolymerase [Nocardia wallacei]|uniref:extracellular catalytic domain type 2 short-chain-length polyhydroxyalkanoate depolymerase n=1 Tax=Nocardia wallacei TaxID=480035 RepID=UPI002457BF6A|nr:PHB depolymerase family esterase [Nocardia wallacei]
MRCQAGRAPGAHYLQCDAAEFAFGAAVVLVTVLGAVPAAHATPQSGLPRLDITDTYVTGVSSGGFLATQLAVAYSGTFAGAGIVAAGPYGCGRGEIVETVSCALGDTGLAGLQQQARAWSDRGLIDPVSNLKDRPVYTYHGTADPLVNSEVSDAGVEFYRHFGAKIAYRDTVPAGHAWPTPAGTVPCGLTLPPFLSDCGGDPQGEMFAHWFGAVKPPNSGAPQGTLSTFDQSRYVTGTAASAISMDTIGMLYTPPACAAGEPCRLVVALHGCASGRYIFGDLFPKAGNLDTYGDTNNLVVLYPQAKAGLLPLNPQGCWDWWGYTGAGYATKSAPQLAAIVAMVRAVTDR